MYRTLVRPGNACANSHSEDQFLQQLTRGVPLLRVIQQYRVLLVFIYQLIIIIICSPD